MHLHLGQKPIKAVLIQTHPGTEFQVAKQLLDACKLFKVEKYAIYKALGGWDIILLYTSDFGFHLTKYGLIPGILKSNTILCFPYRWTESANQPLDVIDSLNGAPFAGFSLMRFNYDGVAKVNEVEKKFFSILDTDFQDRAHTLATLGCNELIVIFTHESLPSIIENFFSMLFDASFSSQKPYPLTKTFSYVAINYETLLGPDWQDQGLASITPEKLKELLNSAPIKEKLAVNLRPDIRPTMRISAPLGSKYQEMKTYWQELNFQCLEVLGEEDLLVVPPQNYHGTWYTFLVDILFFRQKFQHQIQSTCTVLTYSSQGGDRTLGDFDHKEDFAPASSLSIFSPEVVPFEKMEKFFGDKGAPPLATQIYALNSLSHNPITGAVFRSMKHYPTHIITIGDERYDKENCPQESLAVKFTDILGHGLELRSYGTYENVERPYGRYAKLKGGVQRALLAMEYLPTKILNRASDFWFGFVNAYEEPKFSMVQEVLYVPLENLWKPETFWALYHESAHIIIDKFQHLASREAPPIKLFLTSKTDHLTWENFFIELAAEIIGYELGYFGDLDLFLGTLWPYLKDIEPYIKDTISLGPYLNRTFYVEIWEKCYGDLGKAMGSKDVFEKYMKEEYLYEQYWKHVTQVEGIIGEFPEKDFLISNHMSYFRNILPYLNYLYEQIAKLEREKEFILFRRKDWIDGSAERIAEDLLRGRIYWEEIEHPEAVYYFILKNKGRLKTKEEHFLFTLATILTFWNAQLQWLQKGYYARVRPV